MKRLLQVIPVLLILIYANFSFGQNLVQSRVANLVTGDYATTGTVYLETFDNNTIQVRFDTDYATQSNVFDVHVYLTNNTNYSSPINVTNNELIANIGTMTGLNYSSGAMTFPMPASLSIDDYDHIVFVCLSFGQLHWAHGDFTSFTTPTLSDYTESCQATPTPPILNVSGASNITGVSTTPFPISTLGTTAIEWIFDDGSGNYTSASQNVIVTELDVQVNPVQNNLSATQAPSGTNYQWIDCGNNNAAVLGETGSTFLATEEGTYAVIADAGLCLDTSSCVAVSFDDIYDAPVLANLNDFCEVTPATPSILLNNGTFLNGVPDVSFPITATGVTTINWTFTSASGSTLTSQQTVTIQMLSSSLTQNGNVLDAAVTSPSASFQWINCDNNMLIAGETGVTFTATVEGNYAVIANTGMCVDTSNCESVSFGDIYDAPTLSDISDFCEVTPTTPSITLNNGIVLDGVPDVAFPITNAGTTTVTWTFTSASGSVLTSQQDVTIQALSASVSQNGSMLTGSSSDQNASFQWIDCDNNTTIAGETAMTFTATQEGNFALIASSGSCSDTSNCYPVSFANIHENSSELNVQLYPNPSNGEFTILFGELVDYVQVQVLDLSGRSIYQSTHSGVLEIPVSIDADPASYLVTVKTMNGTKLLRYVKE